MFLYSGEVIETVRHTFNFGKHVPDDESDKLKHTYQVKEHVPKDNNILSNYTSHFQIGNVDCELFVQVDFVFNALPGEVLYNLTLIDDAQQQHFLEIKFHVVGVVLYQLDGDDLNILTGKNAQLLLPEPRNGVQEIVVKSRVYNANPLTTLVGPPVDMTKIQLSILPVHDEYDVDTTRELLPWNNSECSINAELDSLNDRCAMAFSEDFSSFKLRVANNRRLDYDVSVEIQWEGMKEYATSFESEDGLVVGSNSDVLPDDNVSSMLIRPNSAHVGGLAPWKLAVVIIVAFLVVAAAVTLVCCCVCGRNDDTGKPGPLSKRVSAISNHVVMALRGRPGGYREDSDDVDNIYVENPSSEETSTVLMLEGSVRRASVTNMIMMAGRAGNCDDDPRVEVADDGTKKDMGAERLVLPRAVTRGIDLEPSTGDESNRFPFSDDDVYFAHGMTSVPEEMYEVEDDEDEGRYAVMEREQSRASEEDSGTIGAETTVDRSGVGAAIRRVRQVDQLHGPASKGLVGRNGEPIQESPTDNANGSACPLSVSTVS